MGYPNFGKVKTLTLPIPDSSMTFAQYKNAYGIDLQQLENTELILLKESSGEVVPVLYYDKENAVLYTANYSIDISAGFEVETDSLISKVIADGTIENAKPIYCHPICFSFLRTLDENIITITCLIFNNSETAFTKATFVDWVKNLFSVNNNAKIMASGYIATRPCSYIGISNSPEDSCFLRSSSTLNQDSDYTMAYSDILADSTLFTDGVNKIN